MHDFNLKHEINEIGDDKYFFNLHITKYTKNDMYNAESSVMKILDVINFKYNIGRDCKYTKI